MGTGDIEDPRELAALREEAEARLTQANGERLEIVVALLNMEEKQQEVSEYLMAPDPEMIALIKDSGPFGSSLSEARYQTEQLLWNSDNEAAREGQKRLLEIKSPMNMDKFARITTEAVVVKDEVSRMRTGALLAKETGVAGYEQSLKKNFLKSVAIWHTRFRIPFPEKLKFILSGSDLTDAIQEFEEGRAIGAEAKHVLKEIEQEKIRGQLEKSGVHPRFAEKKTVSEHDQIEEKRKSAFAQMRENNRQKLLHFMEKYPDPRVFVDLALGLKDGKLPV